MRPLEFFIGDRSGGVKLPPTPGSFADVRVGICHMIETMEMSINEYVVPERWCTG